jgi:hypothetical protein
MSRANRKKNDYPQFAVRFIEACGTSHPVKIQQLLNISYQAAKNYLDGRVPEPQILMIIAEKTPYSIHWLLTGRGKKFVDHDPGPDTPVLSRQMEESVRRICVEVINDFSGRQTAAQPKVVVLQSGKVLSEKVMQETTAPSD